MITVEIEAPIVNHRIDFSSDKLPSNIAQARIIVMYEELATPPQTPDVIALARAARSSFPKRDPQQLHDEFAAMRSEWNERGSEK